MKKDKVEERKASITLYMGRDIWVYEKEDTDFIKSSNVPHLSVEDRKYWKGWSSVDGNPNIIGQIHHAGEERGIILHLNANTDDKILTKNDLLAIIKGMDYIEDFIEKKK